MKKIFNYVLDDRKGFDLKDNPYSSQYYSNSKYARQWAIALLMANKTSNRVDYMLDGGKKVYSVYRSEIGQ